MRKRRVPSPQQLSSLGPSGKGWEGALLKSAAPFCSHPPRPRKKGEAAGAEVGTVCSQRQWRSGWSKGFGIPVGARRDPISPPARKKARRYKTPQDRTGTLQVQDTTVQNKTGTPERSHLSQYASSPQAEGVVLAEWRAVEYRRRVEGCLRRFDK